MPVKKGRPTKYKKELCEDLVKLMEKGLFDYQICAKWGISRTLFYQWKHKYKEFNDAYEVGEPKCEKWWSDWGIRGMAGEIKGFNYKTWYAFMQAKFKHRGWGVTSADSATNNTQINIGNVNILQNKSVEELDEYIDDLLKEQNIIDVTPQQIEYQSNGF